MGFWCTLSMGCAPVLGLLQHWKPSPCPAPTVPGTQQLCPAATNASDETSFYKEQSSGFQEVPLACYLCKFSTFHELGPHPVQQELDLRAGGGAHSWGPQLSPGAVDAREGCHSNTLQSSLHLLLSNPSLFQSLL